MKRLNTYQVTILKNGTIIANAKIGAVNPSHCRNLALNLARTYFGIANAYKINIQD